MRERRRQLRRTQLLAARFRLCVLGAISWLLVAAFTLWWFLDLAGSISMHLTIVGLMALIGTVCFGWAAEVSATFNTEFGRERSSPSGLRSAAGEP